MSRIDGRLAGELRAVRITPNFTKMAAGSVLYECGDTRVICTASVTDGVPPFLRGKGTGWITAEYAMLPGATPQRKPRNGLHMDGRSVEIQRLIGRALRCVCDLSVLGERTITVDCDVIQADGGTRCAAITGGFVALCLAVGKLLGERKIYDSPVRSQLAAISVGVVDGEAVCDLPYAEDSRAQVDMNMVMTRHGNELRFAEVQGTGEHIAFSRAQMDEMLGLGEEAVRTLMEAQLKVLPEAADVIRPKPLLVLASGSADKQRELKALLGDRYEVRSMKQLGLDMDIEETGKTFEENALIKARAAGDVTHAATLADDSGLEVDALGGRPGVFSARYCGVHGDNEANNDLLLMELAGVPAPRSARYVCALALVRAGCAPVIARGACEGEILHERRGSGGFGYDPLFYVPAEGKTYAELPLEVKNMSSHRALALKALMNALDGERL